MKTSVLFVCLGNICRSPTAEAIFRKLVEDEGLAERFDIDSCGTAPFNVGKHPDPRAQAAAAKKGYDMSQQVARQITPEDYDRFDYFVVMDHINLRNVRTWAPADYKGHIDLFLRFSGDLSKAEIPDPYKEDEKAFDEVFALLEKSASALLEHIRRKHAI